MSKVMTAEEKKRHWEFIAKISKEVAKWPKWKREALVRQKGASA